MRTASNVRARLRRAGDPRVIGGVLIMALSAYLGLLLSNGGPQPVAVAVAVRDLPAGLQLQPGDVELREVLLADPHRYLQPGEVSGSLAIPVASGELVPRRALSGEPPADRLVAVPVSAERLPPEVARGSLVDVWAEGPGPVLEAVPVAGISDPEQWSGATASVVLAVAPEQVADLLGAVRAGVVDVTAYQDRP